MFYCLQQVYGFPLSSPALVSKNFCLPPVPLVVHNVFYRWCSSSSVASFFHYFACWSFFLQVSLPVTRHARWPDVDVPERVKYHVSSVCSRASTSKLLGISPTSRTARQFLTLFSDSAYTFGQLSSRLRLTLPAQRVVPRTAVGLFLLWPDCLEFTAWKTFWYPKCSADSWTATDSRWKHFCSRSASVYSAIRGLLRLLRDCAI